ncbi:glucose-fructose oxidoreductase [Pontibacter ummariensis]|uniref:Glucose-fructose oxidoreductase n=1 Tax=Pontibacter ummariensis TaxID=1610492 RepID=A0A239LEB6_9BACT|nr:Gfo/Idh/MocA family oxidoreductase [Pontibacter ummariensis]PRY03662.1 glucose-fructose oxidoreductase [Pontibacter ummariensis]SNT28248.1 glucose-fructose oxidoreductase [Pontibacter ummariensis]
MAFTSSRRDVLKSLALGTTAALFSPHVLLAATRQPKDRLGVALVGLGYYSTDLLAPALQQTKNCYLAGIVTGTPSKAEEWKKKYNIPDKNIYNYQTFDQIANNPDIDVVYVVLPPSMHHAYTVRASNAGKHVWCEKPMAMTEQECREMIDACNKNKKKLAIGYRLQHDPNTQEYMRVVNQKLLGKVKQASCGAGYRESRTNHWKQTKELGGGALYDMGVYSIQGARLGTGLEPIAIASAKISTTRPEIYTNIDETTVAKLEFPGGVFANIKTSFGENVNYLNIACEKGEIKMEPFQGYAGVKGSSPLGKINHPYEVPWQQAKQMDDDAMAIMQNKPMLVPGEEGLRDIRIVEAIYKAAASGQRVKL